MSVSRKHMLRMSLVLTVVTALLGAMALPALGGSASVSLSPRHGPPTRQVTVGGSGFEPAETVDVTFGASAVATAVADGAGSFTVRLAVPATARPGRHTVAAIGKASGFVAQAPFQVRTDWRQFRDGIRRHGFNGHENVLTPGTVRHLVQKWRVDVAADSIVTQSSPSVVGGRVYVGSVEGYVEALDASSGALVWKTAVSSGGRGVVPSPAVVGGIVYAATSEYTSILYALDAFTGEVMWTQPLEDGYAAASPAVSNGVVYQPGRGDLYAFDAASGAELWSTPLWQPSSPAVANGIVYVGTEGSAAGLYAFRADTGERLWHAKNVGDIEGAPVVTPRTVYVASRNDNVYALRARTGTQIWVSATGGFIRGSLALAQGAVYAGSDDGSLYAFDAGSGALRWRSATESSIWSDVTVAGSVLYVGNWNWFHAFDATTGALLWRTAMPVSMSTPAVVDGRVYASSFTVLVASFGLPKGP